MKICVSRIRIKNFRSIEYAEAELYKTNVLIGQNNSGKSNFLRAINVSLNNNVSVYDKDIYISSVETLRRDKTSVIDLMICPVDEDGSRVKDFSAFWVSVFTEKWISIDVIEGSFVGIRTIIKYDERLDQYITLRRVITQWNDSIDEAVCGGNQNFTSDMQFYIRCFYMDARRDFIEDMNSKKSYFGRAISISNQNVSESLVRDVEEQLNSINQKILEGTSTFNSVQKMIASMNNLFNFQKGQIYIEPISCSINDLNRGIDVKVGDGVGPILSVSEQGMGMRSWISFLTLKAYISHIIHSVSADDEEAEIFVVLTLEEPEAHLHSYAQKKLFGQIESFEGQKFISTHSANIVARANIRDLLHLYKSAGRTVTHRVDIKSYETEEMAKIKREFIRSKGEILFSTVVVLAEGITEEIALPVYFRKHFGFDPTTCGIAIIGIGGQNYKSFLHLLNDFQVPWFIFSDGEESSRKVVEHAIHSICGEDCLNIDEHVVILSCNDNYETYLINEGYSSLIIDAINKYERSLREEYDPEGAKRDQRTFFERCLKKSTSEQKGCSESEKIRSVLLDCFNKNNGKAKYAYIVAEEIVNNADENRKIPPKIKELFDKIEKTIKIMYSGELFEN